MYHRSHGVSRNQTEAKKWYRRAANQGHNRTLAALGLVYFAGKGVPPDYVQAQMWFDLAAARFPPGEDRELSLAMRDGLAEEMSPEQLAEARRLAREWKPKE
jgi:hypothetical protein